MGQSVKSAARKSATPAALRRVAALITRRDMLRGNVSDARRRVAESLAWVARTRSAVNRARHAARPAAIGTAAMSAAATLAGVTLAAGVTVKLTAEHVAALAVKYPSFAPLAGAGVTVSVAALADGTLRGFAATPAATRALTEAEREHAEAEREHARDTRNADALAVKRDAATEAVKSALAAMSTADRASARALAAEAATGV